jgi:hypothetical protein
MTALQKKPIVWTDETLEGAINGAFTVTMWNQNVPYKLTKEEKQVFDQGKKQGYVLVGKRDNLRNAFSQWCEIHNKPYIYAEQRGKYASVKMDLIFCDETHNYEEDHLFEEKLLTVITAVGIKNTEFSAGGTYTYVSAVLSEHADYTARSFCAIYQQYHGITVKAPAFPEGTNAIAMFAQVQESKEQKFALCRKGQRWLNWRWKTFCDAYHWPYIKVDEERKGKAKVEVVLPESVTFQVGEVQAITKIALEVGLKADTSTLEMTYNRFLCYDRSMRMLYPIPTIDAIRLADEIVTILDRAGYFPAIDESWHE